MMSSPMQPDHPPARRSPVALFIAGSAGLAAVFTIPFFIPVQPAISESYRYGFNNHAALLLFLTFAAAFAWWAGHLPGDILVPSAASSNAPLFSSRRPLWIALAVTGSLTMLLALLMRSVGVINEAAYISDRLRQLNAGHTLYTGFEFAYGPAMLYFPLFIHRAFYIDILDAYYIAWMLSWLAGIWMLWTVIRIAAANSPRRNTVFYFFFLSVLPWVITFGANYTPLRFLAAPCCAVLVCRAAQSGRRPAVVALAALTGGACILSYSPELGLAYAAATFLFCAFFYLPEGLFAATEALGILLAGNLLLAAIGIRLHLFDSMRAMGSGAFNSPLLPSIGSITILLAWLIAACLLANTIRSGRRVGVTDYLILVGFAGLAGAFGRSDPGHMFSNTLGALLAAWIVLSFRTYARKLIWGTFALTSLTLPLGLYQSNNFVMMPVKSALLGPGNPQPHLRRLALFALQHTIGPAHTAAELAKWDRTLPKINPAWNTPADRSLLAPLGYRSNLRVVGSVPPMTNGFFFGYANVMLPTQLQHKIDETNAHPGGLLLFTEENSCTASPASSDSASEAREDREDSKQLLLNLQPFYLPRVRNRIHPYAALCENVLHNYHPSRYVAPFQGASILEPNPR